MQRTKAILENLAKVFLNIGQGIILGSIATGFFGKDVIQSFVGLFVGIYTVLVGLYLISESHEIEDRL